MDDLVEVSQAKEHDDENEVEQKVKDKMAPFFKIADSLAQAAMLSIHIFRVYPLNDYKYTLLAILPLSILSP